MCLFPQVPFVVYVNFVHRTRRAFDHRGSFSTLIDRDRDDRSLGQDWQQSLLLLLRQINLPVLIEIGRPWRPHHHPGPNGSIVLRLIVKWFRLWREVHIRDLLKLLFPCLLPRVLILTLISKFLLAIFLLWPANERDCDLVLTRTIPSIAHIHYILFPFSRSRARVCRASLSWAKVIYRYLVICSTHFHFTV